MYAMNNNPNMILVCHEQYPDDMHTLDVIDGSTCMLIITNDPT